ncbi:MAG: hypothetical protein M3299_12155, partial [Thermoproteota archaeon]|nr:hypothetical protein [Thermoproteota archaeon]
MRFGQNHQQQQQLLYQYKCLQCGAVLKETKTPIDSSIFRFINNERCAICGNVLQEQTIVVVAVQHPPLRPPQNNVFPRSPHPVYALQSQLPMIFETAYNIQHRSTKLAFDIAEIDS